MVTWQYGKIFKKIPIVNAFSALYGWEGGIVSKETVFKIKETEAEAQRILAEAEAEAKKMIRAAQAEGARLRAETERETAAGLAAMTQQIRQKAEEHTARVLEEAAAEADELAERVKLTRRVAEKLVIRGLEAKCR